MAVEGAYTAEDYAVKGVTYEAEYITNARKMKLFTMRWLPANAEPKALIFLLHGYGVECGLWWQDTGLRLAQGGYAAFGIDFEGHGRSDGRRAYLTSMDPLVDDVVAYMKGIREKEEFKDKPRFLYGESMGGAVTLLVHRREPTLWNGAVLIAPMVKISDKVKPPPVVVEIMKKLALVLPTWAIVPSKDIITAAYKDPVKREMVRNNKYSYTKKPRLGTSLVLLNVSTDLEARVDEVTVPFLLLHGEADTVTDPLVSQHLYDNAKSFDKTFKTYEGMWHSLTEGEPDDNVELVFKDILSWLDSKTASALSN